MSLDSGRRLGPYQVIAPVGAGGMGEVYRARDTRLDRSVAIKILPQRLSSSPELRQRFEREAKAISSLSHPHICALFDVGHEEGISFLVMEYLEGETLASKLARGALPLQEALRYSIEIGSALERAHRSGIVHRDLKPGNIVITKAGAKLVDFGLAKAKTDPTDIDGATIRRSSPEPITTDGAILGTYPYMSPEQLEGREADARSDIFAYGAVLYEMVTGKRAFPGNSTASVIAAIMTAQPAPIPTVRGGIPHELDQIICTALEKDPDERWQSAHDMVVQLKRIASGAIEPRVESRPRNRLLAWSGWLVALLLGVATLFAVARSRRPAEERAALLAIEPPAGLSPIGATISRDGETIVMAAEAEDGAYSCWYRKTSERTYTPLPNMPELSGLLWSPDGKEFAHVEDFKLRRRRLGSDRSEVICDTRLWIGGDWLEDGTIVFTPNFGSPVMKVPASGGTPVAITDPPSRYGESLAGFPRMLESGRLMYLARKTAGVDSAIYVTDPKPGASRKKIIEADAFVDVVDEHLLFVRDSVLYAIPFDLGSEQVKGSPRKVVDHVSYDPGGAVAFVTAARTGQMVFSDRPFTKSQVLLVDAKGAELKKIGNPMPIVSCALSNDARRIAFTVANEKTAAADVYSFDVARGVWTPVSVDPSPKMRPTWSADGKSIYYTADKYGYFDIFRRSADGSGAEEVVIRSEVDKVVLLSPEPNAVLHRISGDPERRIRIFDGNTKQTTVTGLTGRLDRLQLSPDGRTIAFIVTQGTGGDVFIASYPDGKNRVQISSGGGDLPRFSPDGKTLYYHAADRTVRAVELLATSSAVDAGAERTLFNAGARLYVGPTADGNFLLADIIKPVNRWPYFITDWRPLVSK